MESEEPKIKESDGGGSAEDQEIKKTAVTLGIIFALIPIIIYLQPTFETWLTKSADVPEFEIPLIKGSVPYNQLKDEIEYNLYVPDFDVKIFLSPEKNEVGPEEKIKFFIEIQSIGKVSLKNPYFYILLAKDEEIVAMFPEVSKIKTLSFTDPSYYSYEELGWETWETEDHFNKYYSDSLKINFNDDDYYVPRWTLVNGTGKYVYPIPNSHKIFWTELDHKITYSFDHMGKRGTWEIFVLVFDEEYYDRHGQVVPDDHIYIQEQRYNMKNALGYESVLVNVVGVKKEEKDELVIWDVLKLLIVAFTSLGIFTFVYRITISRYETLKKKSEEILKDKYYFFGLITLVLLMILIYLYTFSPS